MSETTTDPVLEAMRTAAKKGPANWSPDMRRVLRAALEEAMKQDSTDSGAMEILVRAAFTEPTP